MTEHLAAPKIDFNTPAAQRKRTFRALKDRLATWIIAVGGISVIGAVMLIFFYLLYQVAPMFVPADIKQISQYASPAQGENSKTLFLAMEEQAEIAARVQQDGTIQFFATLTGELIQSEKLPINPGVIITSIGQDEASSRLLVLGLSSGKALIIKHHYSVTYPNDVRLITPEVQFPYGTDAIEFESNTHSLTQISIRDGEDSLLVAAKNDQGDMLVSRFVKEEDFISEEITLEQEQLTIEGANANVHSLLIDASQRWLFTVDEREITLFDLQEEELHSHMPANDTGSKITQATLLLGGNSLMLTDEQGEISQWFLVRAEQGGWKLQKIRTFEGDNVTHIISEHRRKGFITASGNGELGIYHSTASRTLFNEKLIDEGISKIAVSPRGKNLLVEDKQGDIHFFSVDNEHPEVSWVALWEEVWYENYEAPAYVWQSSASNNDFEPKYSLIPLAFGTLKGAFYAMLLAAPLAICGAIYTAYFMAPALRRKIKPVIELMEALPTVILGFLAGLALAPFIEGNLPGIFALMTIVPIGIVAFGFLWSRMPESIRHRIPDGWDPVLLIPVIVFLGWAAFAASSGIENMFFGGSMVNWLTNDIGIDFSQRNALIVGLAMGFAVIPTIFSIAEDAIFSVPKSMSYGSLALGATPWQTMLYVVLPTASPGIFSALMIGMGRAVGETMIVLMATGNTPITDINIFEGMRTLAANIAVEIPESEVGSSHYRILFLTGFVLFCFTFVFNTAAEIVRQRLRNKYGSL
jgi:phosphate transport system permease protein